MPDTTIPIKPEKRYTWERWLAGRAKRRYLGNLVAPAVIRRDSSSSDPRLRAAFDGERGPSFAQAAFDGRNEREAEPAADERAGPDDEIR